MLHRHWHFLSILEGQWTPLGVSHEGNERMLQRVCWQHSLIWFEIVFRHFPHTQALVDAWLSTVWRGGTTWLVFSFLMQSWPTMLFPCKFPPFHFQCERMYHIAGKLQGRKLSRFCGYLRKFSPRNLGVFWHGKSEQSAKVFSMKIVFYQFESFLPWKFHAILLNGLFTFVLLMHLGKHHINWLCISCLKLYSRTWNSKIRACLFPKPS